MSVLLAVLVTEVFEREVYVGIFYHGRLFCRVLAGKHIPGHRESAAVPRVDCSFGAGEGVGTIDDKLRAEKLGGAA